MSKASSTGLLVIDEEIWRLEVGLVHALDDTGRLPSKQPGRSMAFLHNALLIHLAKLSTLPNVARVLILVRVVG
jgi:hypothetical protein